ncbi:hypothetical protein HK102_010305, partial [Quaeritorhiza haematococci]
MATHNNFTSALDSGNCTCGSDGDADNGHHPVLLVIEAAVGEGDDMAYGGVTSSNICGEMKRSAVDEEGEYSQSTPPSSSSSLASSSSSLFPMVATSTTTTLLPDMEDKDLNKPIIHHHQKKKSPPVLFVPDIIFHICNQLTEDSSANTGSTNDSHSTLVVPAASLSARDLHSCALVCRAWAPVGVELLYKFPRPRNTKALRRLLNTLTTRLGFASLVHGIDLSRIRTVVPARELQRLCDVLAGNVRFVDFRYCKELRDEQLVAIGGASRTSSSSTSSSSLVELVRRPVHGLHLAENRWVTDKGLVDFAMSRRAKDLAFLSVEGCPNVTDASLARFAVYCPHLELLKLCALPK